jgi:hypothetical protein
MLAKRLLFIGSIASGVCPGLLVQTSNVQLLALSKIAIDHALYFLFICAGIKCLGSIARLGWANMEKLPNHLLKMASVRFHEEFASIRMLPGGPSVFGSLCKYGSGFSMFGNLAGRVRLAMVTKLAMVKASLVTLSKDKGETCCLRVFLGRWLAPWLLCALCMVAESAPVTAQLNVHVDWKEFLARHDLVWERMPQSWDEAPFMGNGMLGTMLYQSPGANALRLDVGRSDAQDHRTEPPDEHPAYARARLPIGHFLLKPRGRILEASRMRLDLWNAETTGKIVTDKGGIEFKTYVHADEMLIVFEATTAGDENNFSFEWQPANAISPRQQWGLSRNEKKRSRANYQPNPPPVLTTNHDVNVCLQPLLQGGQTATAWEEIRNGNSRRLLVSVAHAFPQTNACQTAVAVIKSAATKEAAVLSASHRDWWHRYYPQSFVSFSDTRLESFYWIQMYKLASATRADRALIDNQGPWLEETAWPYATWNLNVQLTYWPVYTANRLDLGDSMLNSLVAHQQQLMENIPAGYRADSSGIGRATGLDLAGSVGIPGPEKGSWTTKQENVPEVGLLPWTLHNVWLQYRYSMDDAMLRNKIFPLLRRSMNYYLHFLQKGADGKLHLPATYSPEYGSAPDCNFDLALVRWECQALLESCERLKIEDPLRAKWRETLDTLADYPRDENGFMIGRGESYAKSHRHYSHLLMIYPLYLVNLEQPGGAELISQSLACWQGKPGALRGFSLTGASSISSALGRGNDALNYLRQLDAKFLRPNTMYKESGPVIETPLSAAQSIHDMLLQSWGGKIRVFPAVPDAWLDAAFHDLRAEGAFLVSAKRANRKTQFIRVKSLAGEPCIIKTDLVDPIAFVNGKQVELAAPGANEYRVELSRDSEVLLYPRGGRPEIEITPVKAAEANCNTYGLNKRTNQ